MSAKKDGVELLSAGKEVEASTIDDFDRQMAEEEGGSGSGSGSWQKMQMNSVSARATEAIEGLVSNARAVVDAEPRRDALRRGRGALEPI